MKSEAHIEFADPLALASRLIDHLAEHEIAFETRDGVTVADLGDGKATLTVKPRHLDVGVEGRDLGYLEMLRSVIASHIVEFAGEDVSIRWSGSSGTRLANFCEMRVKSVVDLTPHMRRLTLTGSDLARFASTSDLHVRVFIPPSGLDVPEWPMLGEDGRIVWPAAPNCPAMRYYTIRRVDIESGQVDVDFMIHPTAGPGSDFAMNAGAGAILGVAGPLGRTIGTAAWHLLAGDETALPAIARILETMPRDAHGAALIEVGGPEDEVAIEAPVGMTVRWLHRNGVPAGEGDRLVTAVRDAPWPAHQDVFVWAGCEFTAAKAMRKYVETERGLSRNRHLIVGYWSR